MQDVKAKCKRDFLSAYAAELVFWPTFQALNFWKIPVRHQLLAVNLACLLDATFLCWYAAKPEQVACMHARAACSAASCLARRIQQQDDWVEKVLPGWGKGGKTAAPDGGAHKEMR